MTYSILSRLTNPSHVIVTQMLRDSKLKNELGSIVRSEIQQRALESGENANSHYEWHLI